MTIVIVVFVILVGIAAYFSLKGKKQTNSKSNGGETSERKEDKNSNSIKSHR